MLLNVVATLSSSAKLDEWTRTADISLACANIETWKGRQWEVYGLHEEVVEVCSMETAITVIDPCVSSCFWNPELTTEALVCEDENTFEERFEEREGGIEGFNPCDCPCTSLIHIEKPRLSRC
jgi:hypothetical protein